MLVVSGGLVAERLGQARELRPLHADISAAARDLDALRRSGLGEAFLEARSDRMGHGDMGNAALAEKGALAPEGPVHELVNKDEAAWRKVLAE
jgi:hypothetical protein